MAGTIVQWTINEFWGQLQTLKNRITGVEAQLVADKADLQAAYSKTRTDPDPARAALNRKLLDPLIHRNSELRLSYLQPIKSKFNEAVALASAALKKAGYTTPTLSGLGLAPLVVAPLAAITIVLVALTAIGTVALLTDAQRVRTRGLVASLEKAKTPAEVQQVLDATARELKAEGDAHPPLGLDLGALVPILGLVVAIMVLPKVLPLIPRGRTAVAA